MENLDFYDVDPVDELVWPDRDQEIALDAHALAILTDFKEHKPLIVDVSATAVEAESLMRKAHVRMKIVVDKDSKFLGIIDLNDLNGQELIKRVAEGHCRDKMMITEFMQPKEMLKVLDYEELQTSSVGEVVEALKSSGQQHCLVVDRKRHQIRGVISASDLARHLKLPVDISNDSSFLAIFKEICHESNNLQV